MELKNTARELCEAYTNFKAKLIKRKKGYQRLKINSMNYSKKARLEKERVKRNEQRLQEIWDYVKRPNLC